MIRVDGRSADTSLEDVFVLPEGYRCVDGFLVTYELNLDTLCRRVLAPLAGLEPGPIELLLRDAPALTVVCQRPWPGPVLPEQVQVLTWPSSDRPLHVKAGLLRFEHPDGRRKTLVRSYVGSTNLTDGGFGRNRETLVWSEDVKASNGTLNVAVSAICRAVAAAAGSEQADLDARLKTLLNGFFEPLKLPATVRHTIDEPSLLLDGVSHPAGFDRLDVISPPFWQAHTGPKVAEALQPVLPTTGTVRLLTSTTAHLSDDGPVTVAFPTSLVRALEAPELTVEPGVVSEHDGDGRRPLHAKAYVLHGAERSTLVLGSANATHSGLGGTNREAVVLLDLPRDEAESLVDAIGPWHTDVELDESQLARRDPEADQPAALVGVTAIFTPDAGAPAGRRSGSYRGRLVIAGLDPHLEIRIGVAGRWFDAVADADGRVDVAKALGEGDVELDLAHAEVQMEIDGRSRAVLVTLTANDGWLAEQIARLDAPPRHRQQLHPSEQLLLRDLRLLQRERRAGRPAVGPNAFSAAVDDRLTLPIDRRLQIILRYRRSARDAISDEVLADYLDASTPDDPRVQVARAALNDDLGSGPHDPLIDALHRALQSKPAGKARS